MTVPNVFDIRQVRVEEESILNQVSRGLKQEPKTLPALLFYSTEGIQHWNNHARAADFYPRHEEMRTLETRASEMAESIADQSVVIDLGSANLDKAMLLLVALEKAKKNVDYYALDLSSSELSSSLKEIPVSRFQYVRLGGLHGTFEDGLCWARQTPGVRDRPVTLLLFGLTIGNFSRSNAATFLQNMVRQILGANPSQSSIILSLDSCKIPTKVLRAYTADGVVPFALASLTHTNFLLAEEGKGTVFNVDDWHYLSEWNYRDGRHEASLIPRSKTICLGEPFSEVVVRPEEKVRFGCSYKYDDLERGELFCSAGVDEVAGWSVEGCHVAFYQLRLRQT